MKTKPFDLKQAKAGAKVVTRDGRPARIICWDAVGKYPIIALLDCGKEGEIPYNYTTHGTTVIGCVTSDYDLLLVDETPDELTEFEQAVESICLTMQAGGKIDDIHTLSNNLLDIARKELPTNEEMLRTLHLEYEKGRADAFAEMEAIARKENKNIGKSIPKNCVSDAKCEIPTDYPIGFPFDSEVKNIMCDVANRDRDWKNQSDVKFCSDKLLAIVFDGIKDFAEKQTYKDILASFFDGKISGIYEVLENPNRYGLVKVMEDNK